MVSFFKASKPQGKETHITQVVHVVASRLKGCRFTKETVKLQLSVNAQTRVFQVSQKNPNYTGTIQGFCEKANPNVLRWKITAHLDEPFERGSKPIPGAQAQNLSKLKNLRWGRKV